MPSTESAVKLTAEQRAQIKDIVCEILEIESAEMTDTSLFKEQHGADSLGSIEILSSLERNFDVEIDQSALTRMVNLDGVVAVVEAASTK